MLAPSQSSRELMQAIIRLDVENQKHEAKMELVLKTNELMPAGKPKFLDVVKYPMIKDLVKSEGSKVMLTVLTLLVKDFCASVNVVRNMNEDQMIEAAAMLLEECDNFRLEDYVMMFSMAKKGAFHPQVKIMDRVDISLISSIVDAYWGLRSEAGRKEQEKESEKIENIHFENLSDRANIIFDGQKGYAEKRTTERAISSFGASLQSIKHLFDNTNESELRKQIFINQNYKNPYTPKD